MGDKVIKDKKIVIRVTEDDKIKFDDMMTEYKKLNEGNFKGTLDKYEILALILQEEINNLRSK